MINNKTFTLLMLVTCLLTANFTKAQQWGDYTLYSVQGTKKAYLLDTNGTTFHTWSLASGSTGYSVYMLPGGYLLRTLTSASNSFQSGGITGEIHKADYNGNILWDYVYSTSSY